MRKLKLFIIILILIVNKSFSQSSQNVRAMWIFNIANSVRWENLYDGNEFVIGVFSSEDDFASIQKLAETRKIHKLKVKAVRYKNLNEIKPNQIIFVTKNENANLEFVFKELKKKNVLIITDQSKQPQYSVINLNKTSEKQPFTINSKLYKMQKLKLSPSLLRLGGNRDELKQMQANTNKKLLKAIQENEILKKEIEVLKYKLKKCEENNKVEQ